MRIPLIEPDLPKFDSVADRFSEVISNGKVTNFGRYVHEFEENCATFLGTYVITVSSGTLGLLFALQAAGLKKNPRVIVPSFTFSACAQAILYAGGIPEFVDIGEDMNISTDDLQRILDEKNDVGAVLPVHMFGRPCDTENVELLVCDYSRRIGYVPAVIFDAAHAFGSTIKNKKVGRFGVAEVFSLSATKPMSAIEGGLISSKDVGFIKRIEVLRNYGIGRNYNAESEGLNGKMSEFHAIVGIENLSRIEQVLSMRTQLAHYLRTKISECTNFRIPAEYTAGRSTHKDFPILLPKGQEDKRPNLIRLLRSKGIETRTYFSPPLHQQTCFSRYSNRRLDNTEDIAKRILILPFYTNLKKPQIDFMVEALWEANRRVF